MFLRNAILASCSGKLLNLSLIFLALILLPCATLNDDESD